MQKIYIEITNLTEVKSLTGIQRVEKSVALEMYKMIREQLCFVVFKADSYRFEMLDTDLFIDYLKGDKSAFDKMFSGKFLVYEEVIRGIFKPLWMINRILRIRKCELFKHHSHSHVFFL